jgi:hypothetical protein
MRKIFRDPRTYQHDSFLYKVDFLEFVLTLLGYESQATGIELFMWKRGSNGKYKVCYFEDEGYVTWEELDE